MYEELKKGIAARKAVLAWKRATLEALFPKLTFNDPVDDAQRIFVSAPDFYAVLQAHEEIPFIPRIGGGPRKWVQYTRSNGLIIYILR